MIFEGPLDALEKLNKERDTGYNHTYSESLIKDLNKTKLVLQKEINVILNSYENYNEVKEIIKRGLPKEGSYHRGSLVSIVALEGKESEEVINRVSASSELYYWGGSWQDDVADDNSFRQDAKSIRKITDDVTAMYVGNTVFGIVLKSISDSLQDQPEKLSKVMGYFSTDFHATHRGQVIDMLLTKEKIVDVSIDRYNYLVKQTTGVDIGCQLAIGATLAELSEDNVNNLYNFGVNLGTLAQIRDDVLDYCDIKMGGQYIIGKDPFRDVESGKKRIPLLLTGDYNLKELSDDVYSKIEENMAPFVSQANKSLKASTISSDAKDKLGNILSYWSDIEIFKVLNKNKDFFIK